MADIISRPADNSVMLFICFWAEVSLLEKVMLSAIFAQHSELQCCLLVSFFSSPKLSIPLTNAPVRWLIWKWAAENFHRLSNARSHYPVLRLQLLLRCTANLCKCTALHCLVLCLVLCYCVTWYCVTPAYPAWYFVWLCYLILCYCDTVLHSSLVDT